MYGLSTIPLFQTLFPHFLSLIIGKLSVALAKYTLREYMTAEVAKGSQSDPAITSKTNFSRSMVTFHFVSN